MDAGAHQMETHCHSYSAVNVRLCDKAGSKMKSRQGPAPATSAGLSVPTRTQSRARGFWCLPPLLALAPALLGHSLFPSPPDSVSQPGVVALPQESRTECC